MGTDPYLKATKRVSYSSHRVFTFDVTEWSFDWNCLLKTSFNWFGYTRRSQKSAAVGTQDILECLSVCANTYVHSLSPYRHILVGHRSDTTEKRSDAASEATRIENEDRSVNQSVSEWVTLHYFSNNQIECPFKYTEFIYVSTIPVWLFKIQTSSFINNVIMGNWK